MKLCRLPYFILFNMNSKRSPAEQSGPKCISVASPRGSRICSPVELHSQQTNPFNCNFTSLFEKLDSLTNDVGSGHNRAQPENQGNQHLHAVGLTPIGRYAI